jgi:ParB family chromosome partitioning protein
MAARKTGLGRGLDALLGDVQLADEPAAASNEGLQQIPVDLLQRGAYQPRQQFGKEALQELADSIRSQGMVQPIVVRPLTSGGEKRFEIIAGERRWRAAQLAGLEAVPAVVREIPDSAAIAVALIENIQREDLNPLEEARGIRRLIEEFELTHQQAAEAIGRSRTAVSNILRLLDLGPETRTLLEAGELEMGHARALLGLVSSREQAEAAAEVARRGLSVRETEQLVRRRIEGKDKAAPRTLDPDVRRLQDDLAERLGAKVAIQHSAAGKGKLVIAYNNLEELDGILEHIR